MAGILLALNFLEPFRVSTKLLLEHDVVTYRKVGASTFSLVIDVVGRAMSSYLPPLRHIKFGASKQAGRSRTGTGYRARDKKLKRHSDVRYTSLHSGAHIATLLRLQVNVFGEVPTCNGS